MAPCAHLLRAAKNLRRALLFHDSSRWQETFDAFGQQSSRLHVQQEDPHHKKTESAPMNRLVLLMLPILASLHHLTAAASSITAEDTGCRPATCGNLTITYPFWLAGRDTSCGPPGFQLTCNSSGAGLIGSYIKDFQIAHGTEEIINKLTLVGLWCIQMAPENRPSMSRVIEMLERDTDDLEMPPKPFLCSPLQSTNVSSCTSVVVLDIDYGSRSLVAVHALLAAGEACGLLFNMSSALAIMDRFRISPSNRELYVMFNCDGTLPSPAPGAVPVTNCSGNTSNFVYLGGSYGTGQPPANDGRCELAELLVLGSEAAGATAASYRRLIKAGFRLEWGPVGDCQSCRSSGGRCRYDNNTAAFACLCSDGSLLSSNCVSLSAAACLAFICLPWLMYHHKKEYRSVVYRFYSTGRSNEEQVLRKCGSLSPRRFKYSELKKITKSFKEKLGQGGFGVVFRGCLHDGRMVAVKLLKVSDGNREDFLNEVVSISQTSHVNIVSLLGFCLEGSKRALVYEYMPNGSLQNHIYSELATGWDMLLKIAIGIARGLEYLHQGCNTRIIHFDIKPHNILLDNEFCPKIADFGLAKLCHLNGSILSTAEARGTVGFIAPEVFSRGFGVVSTKSDVYSYGMVLLEMVRGTKEIKEDADNSSETYFPHWVYDQLMRDMQDCRVAYGTEEIVNKLTLVGLWCIQMAPENRPSMSRVIEMLERDTDDLEMPPKPFLCSPLQSTIVSSCTSVVLTVIYNEYLSVILHTDLKQGMYPPVKYRPANHTHEVAPIGAGASIEEAVHPTPRTRCEQGNAASLEPTKAPTAP
ncbi:hypothetical protein EJB05_31707, partial [Eragrostis curvula]